MSLNETSQEGLAPQSTFSKTLERREKERARTGELKAKKWVSTGDLPYKFATELNKLSGFFENHIPAYVREVLSDEGEEYARNNTEKIGRKTFISPDLIQKVRERFLAAGISLRTAPLY